MFTKYSIYDSPASFDAREVEDLAHFGLWEKEKNNETELWKNISNFEIHLRKYQPHGRKEFFTISIGKWTGDANWASRDNMVYNKHFFDWSHFLEQVRDSTSALSSGYHYSSEKEYEFPQLELYNKPS